MCKRCGHCVLRGVHNDNISDLKEGAVMQPEELDERFPKVTDGRWYSKTVDVAEAQRAATLGQVARELRAILGGGTAGKKGLARRELMALISDYESAT